MMMNRAIIGIIFTACLIYVSVARSDTTIVFQETGEKASSRSQQTVYVGNGKVMIGDRKGNGSYLLYRSEDRTLAAISRDERSYIVIDEETFSQSSGEMSDDQKRAMAGLEERYKTLPPAKQKQLRSIMENIMRHSRPSGKKQESLRYLPLSQSRTVNGYECRITETHRGMSKIAELCMVNRQDLHISKEDYATLHDFQTFMKEMTSKVSRIGENAFIPDLGHSAHEQIPVQIIRFSENGSTNRYQLKSITNESIPEDRFVVPAGYTERKLTR